MVSTSGTPRVDIRYIALVETSSASVANGTVVAVGQLEGAVRLAWQWW